MLLRITKLLFYPFQLLFTDHTTSMRSFCSLFLDRLGRAALGVAAQLTNPFLRPAD